MRYGIIGAMDSEIMMLLDELHGKKETVLFGTVYYEGILAGCSVVIAKSGVGKVNAGIAAALMINAFAVDAVINTGVSGALSSTLDVGQVAIATALVQHDMDTSPIGDPVGFVSGPDIIEFPADDALSLCAERAARSLGLRVERGVIASGDQFIASREEKERIRSRFGAISCEMEGAAIAHACYLAEVPFAVIRSISDSADGGAHVDFPVFAREAAKQSCRILLAMLGGEG